MEEHNMSLKRRNAGTAYISIYPQLIPKLESGRPGFEAREACHKQLPADSSTNVTARRNSVYNYPEYIPPPSPALSPVVYHQQNWDVPTQLQPPVQQVDQEHPPPYIQPAAGLMNLRLGQGLEVFYPFLVSIECTFRLGDGSRFKTDQIFRDEYGVYAIWQPQRPFLEQEMYVIQLKDNTTTAELELALSRILPYRDRATVTIDLGQCCALLPKSGRPDVVWNGMGRGSLTYIRSGDDLGLFKVLDLIRVRGFKDYLRLSYLCELALV